MFVLYRLNKPTVSCPFLFCFHRTSLISSLFVTPRRLGDLGSTARVQQDLLHFPSTSLRGWPEPSFTARIERALS
jgi:hypothetical protein